jgi:hypothetical protein
MKKIETGVSINWSIEVPDDTDEQTAYQIANDCLVFKLKQPTIGSLHNQDGDVETFWK